MAGARIWDFWASRYEGLWVQRVSLGPSRRLLLARLTTLAPTARTLLDAGCATGQLLRDVAVRWPHLKLHGLDPSAAMIKAARGHSNGVVIDYRVGTLHDEPRGPFDMVIMSHAFPYVGNHALAARRLFDLVAPGGRLLLMQANAEGHYDDLALGLVKLTTSAAVYHPVVELQALCFAAGFRCGEVTPLQGAPFLPHINLCEFTR